MTNKNPRQLMRILVATLILLPLVASCSVPAATSTATVPTAIALTEAAPAAPEPPEKAAASTEPATEPTQETEQVAEPITLHIIMESVAPSDYVEQLIPEFEEAYGIKVSIEKVSFEQMLDKLMPSFTVDTNPYDVITIDSYLGYTFEKPGWLEPLDDYIKESGFDTTVYLPSLVALSGKFQGNWLQIPMYNYAMGYVYRTDIFGDPELQAAYKAESGKDLRVPTTMQEHVDMATFITKYYKDTANPITGAAMDGQPTAVFGNWATYLYSMGGAFYDSTWKPIIDSVEGQQSLDLYIDAIHNAAQAYAVASTWGDSYQVFAQGKAATFIGYNWMLPQLNDPAQSSVVGKVELAPIPGIGGAAASWGWAIPKNSAQKAAAWQFIQWVESHDVAKARAMKGSPPTRTDLFRDAELIAKYPYYPVAEEILAKSEPAWPPERGDLTLLSAVTTKVAEAVAGVRGSEETIQQLQTLLEESESTFGN